jgi:hypothetical protein
MSVEQKRSDALKIRRLRRTNEELIQSEALTGAENCVDSAISEAVMFRMHHAFDLYR